MCNNTISLFLFLFPPPPPPLPSNSQVVEWLLGHVAHLPSDVECQKALLAPKQSEKSILSQRSRCMELIMKVG